MAEPCTMVPASRKSSLETGFLLSDAAGLTFTPHHLLCRLHFIFLNQKLN